MHPGAIDMVDSTTYDALLMANGTLTSAKELYSQGKLDSAKDIINNCGHVYNAVREARINYINATTSIQRGEYLKVINETTPKLTSLVNDIINLMMKVK
jgi:hypothetical protein